MSNNYSSIKSTVTSIIGYTQVINNFLHNIEEDNSLEKISATDIVRLIEQSNKDIEEIYNLSQKLAEEIKPRL